ncbi:MAG: hypothetical protein QXT25_02795 [Candidatus Anstonellaceae archaeon]
MASNLPSSFLRGGGASSYTPPSQKSYTASSSEADASASQKQDNSGLALILAGIALLLSLASFYLSFFAEKPLSEYQKQQLLGIADDLRSLQNREIRMTAPTQTYVRINKTYPIGDMFPESFDVPLEFTIPISTQLVGVSAAGHPVVFRVEESVPVKTKVRINGSKAFAGHNITLNKELPMEAVWSSEIRVRAAYGQDLNDIIDRLEALAKK